MAKEKGGKKTTAGSGTNSNSINASMTNSNFKQGNLLTFFAKSSHTATTTTTATPKMKTKNIPQTSVPRILPPPAATTTGRNRCHTGMPPAPAVAAAVAHPKPPKKQRRSSSLVACLQSYLSHPTENHKGGEEGATNFYSPPKSRKRQPNLTSKYEPTTARPAAAGGAGGGAVSTTGKRSQGKRKRTTTEDTNRKRRSNNNNSTQQTTNNCDSTWMEQQWCGSAAHSSPPPIQNQNNNFERTKDPVRVWTSIQDQVRQKMEQHVTMGTPWPSVSSTTTLPTGVSQHPSANTFKCRIYVPFLKQQQYVGSWPRSDQAAQAFVYAKRLLVGVEVAQAFVDDDDEDMDDDNDDTTSDSNDNEDDGSSSWKAIQDQVRNKMEQHVKLGKLFPKLPPGKNELPIGVCRNKYNSYQVQLTFQKKSKYLGCWKEPEFAIQACLYANELIKKLTNTEDNNNNDDRCDSDDNDDDDDDGDNDDSSIDVNSSSVDAVSAWKSIQEQIRKKMDRHMKTGKQYPKIRPKKKGLPTCVRKTPWNTYQVQVSFQKKSRCVGSWKQPEYAAQAVLYAKELIKQVTDNEKQEIMSSSSSSGDDDSCQSDDEDDSSTDVVSNVLEDPGTVWKSIQAQVRTEMERHLKYGKSFPQLPRGKDELPFGVCKTKSNSYQVSIYFPLDKTSRYVGSFKLLKHAAQAAVYAKELIKKATTTYEEKCDSDDEDNSSSIDGINNNMVDSVSVWKSIQGRVHRKMEKHSKSGKSYPKLPPNKDELPTGVQTTKSGTYKVRIWFPLDKTPRYLGTWKRPEHSAQAFLYAKDLIKKSTENKNVLHQQQQQQQQQQRSQSSLLRFTNTMKEREHGRSDSSRLYLQAKHAAREFMILKYGATYAMNGEHDEEMVMV